MHSGGLSHISVDAQSQFAVQHQFDICHLACHVWVAQGSGLGLILFLLYTAELGHLVKAFEL